jgi:hypothetical protein
MLWRMPVDTHAQRIDRWPPPDNRRSTSGSIANSPITIACSAPPTRCGRFLRRRPPHPSELDRHPPRLRQSRAPRPGRQRCALARACAVSAIERGRTPWVRHKNDRRKGRKGRKALAPIQRVGFVSDFNHRAGPVSAARRGRKVAESGGKSLQKLCAGNCPLFHCLTIGVHSTSLAEIAEIRCLGRNDGSGPPAEGP